ncbi:M23 family metallopeptidase [Georgenia yuyongxinii]|uniref:M23 family metallopeptidase n=2 Tax=Georgenia yuyongxinii TaxID=2589797 RepID=A0A552WQU9_9MICO|nr:M23 family metallopeptidase [Georgenia yuyongxinii]
MPSDASVPLVVASPAVPRRTVDVPAVPQQALSRPAVPLRTVKFTDVGMVGGAVVGEVSYQWPTGDPAEVVRAFDPPDRPWDAGHRGVDLAHATAAPVLAAADGVVVFAGTVVDRPVVSVDHADGIRTTYEPVTPVVTAGERVQAGDVLGHLAAGHCFMWQPSCLHWGARRGRDVYVDPLRLVGAQVVVRLLPDDVGLP